MKQDLDDLLKRALDPPPEARAALAGSLLESLDDQVDPAAEEEWKHEIAGESRIWTPVRLPLSLGLRLVVKFLQS